MEMRLIETERGDERIVKLSDKLSVMSDDGALVIVNIETGRALALDRGEAAGLRKFCELAL